MPTISVIMGVYSHEENLFPLKLAIKSILEQSFRDFELLICDDGSVDSIKTFLDEAQQADRRIHLLRFGNRITLPQKLNSCIQQAKGRYIARMDDDDQSMPLRFMHQLDYLQKNPEAAFVGCNVIKVSSDGERREYRYPEWPKTSDFRFSIPYVHPAIMFRKSAIETVGGYSESPDCILCEDMELLMRMHAKGLRGANLQEVLFVYSMVGVETKRRPFYARLNETKVRYRGFRQLGLLPGAFIYVIKPLIVGMLPLSWNNQMRKIRAMLRNRS